MHDDGEIDEDEFLMPHEANRCRNLHVGLPYWKYDRFDSVAMKDLYEDLIEDYDSRRTERRRLSYHDFSFSALVPRPL